MRRRLLPLHIISATGLIGADLSMAILGVAGASGTPPPQVYPAMSAIVRWVMLPLAAVALSSGFLLARTVDGGARQFWVVAKATIATLLAVLLVAALVPGLTAAGNVAAAGRTPPRTTLYAVVPAISSALLIVNVVLATAKPLRMAGLFRVRRAVRTPSAMTPTRTEVTR